MAETVDLQALRRSSHRAASLTLVGALLIFGGLAYSAWRLSGAQAELAAVEDEIAALAPLRDELARDNAALSEERTTLSIEIAALIAERDRLREGFRAVLEAEDHLELVAPSPPTPEDPEGYGHTDDGATAPTKSSEGSGGSRRPASIGDPSPPKIQTRRIPISVYAEPQASRTPISDREATYALWLDLDRDHGAGIAAVSYLLNHPSFRANPRPRATDAATGYRVEYVGWGCLDSVVATVEFTDGAPPETLHFDLCGLLERPPRAAPPRSPRESSPETPPPLQQLREPSLGPPPLVQRRDGGPRPGPEAATKR